MSFASQSTFFVRPVRTFTIFPDGLQQVGKQENSENLRAAILRAKSFYDSGTKLLDKIKDVSDLVTFFT